MSYTKTGNRVSLLPVSQFCGKAAKLSEEHGAGRAAAMSTAFHAKLADPGSPDTRAKMAGLSDKEREQIALWKAPTDFELFGETLKYMDAEKEVPVGLTAEGEFVDNGECLTSGTLDMGWVRPGLAIVADIKKERFTVESPDTLQLRAYAWAWAKAHQITKFLTGIWVATEGEWIWSDAIVDMESFEGLELWETIKHAASNTSGQASTGDHCRSCYGRLHCAEHLAPIELASTWLAPATRGDIEIDELTQMLVMAERIEGMIDKVKEHVKEAVLRGAVIKHPTSGKVYKPTTVAGRSSMNIPLLLKDHPDMTKYMRRGNPYERFAWGKP